MDTPKLVNAKSKKPPELLKVKDLDGGERFTDLHPHLPAPPSCFIIVGAIKSSKSNLIINCLCNPDFYLHRFSVVRVLSTTLHMDNKMKMLDKYFDCMDHYDDSIIEEIKEAQSKYEEKKDRPTYALVLDDVLTKDFSKNNAVSFFSTRFRHYIDFYIIATQTFRAVSSMIRNNSTDVIVARQQNQKELEKIAEEYGDLVGGYESFINLYNQVHNEKYQMMYMKLSENPVQVFKNFSERIY